VRSAQRVGGQHQLTFRGSALKDTEVAMPHLSNSTAHRVDAVMAYSGPSWAMSRSTRHAQP
jgi:hypothetical protein